MVNQMCSSSDDGLMTSALPDHGPKSDIPGRTRDEDHMSTEDQVTLSYDET